LVGDRRAVAISEGEGEAAARRVGEREAGRGVEEDGAASTRPLRGLLWVGLLAPARSAVALELALMLALMVSEERRGEARLRRLPGVGAAQLAAICGRVGERDGCLGFCWGGRGREGSKLRRVGETVEA
jgi:hypothetical protein